MVREILVKARNVKFYGNLAVFNVCCSYTHEKLQIFLVSSFIPSCCLWVSLRTPQIDPCLTVLSCAMHCYYTGAPLVCGKVCGKRSVLMIKSQSFSEPVPWCLHKCFLTFFTPCETGRLEGARIV